MNQIRKLEVTIDELHIIAYAIALAGLSGVIPIDKALSLISKLYSYDAAVILGKLNGQ